MKSTVQFCPPFEAQRKSTNSRFGSRGGWGICWSRVQPTLFVVLLILDAFAPAQGADSAVADPTRSSIRGFVTFENPSGKPITLQGITVKLVSVAQGKTSLTALTDSGGRFQFSQLGAGAYVLDVRVEGLQPFVMTILLAQGELRVENVALHIEQIIQKVEVNGQAPQVATEAAAASSRINDQQYETLPLAERKFKEALPILPGVVRTSDGKLNIKGEAENQGMLLVDSAQTVDPVTGSFSIPVPLDAIQTVQVEKTPYDTEYGGFSGGLTTVETKPPSGQWKYGLMDFIPGIRGKSGHIVGLAQETPRLFFGGPVVKDKLNFSEAATYDYNNVPVRGLAWPHNERQIQGFGSLSSLQAVLSPRHVLSVTVDGFSNRVRYADINSLVPQSASSNDGQRGVSIGATDSYQFHSGALLSVLFQYTRFDSNAHGQGANDMLITPEGWGGDFFNAWARASNQFEFLPLYRSPKIAWLGRHELKAGMDLIHRSYTGSTYSHPIQLLRQDGTLAEAIDFLGGRSLHARDTEAAEFLQDHWLLNDRLALDLGGRLLTQSIGRSAAFAPRAGLVYSAGEDRKTIIRAGSGLFYDRVPILAADFTANPERVVTLFGTNELPLGSPVTFQNACMGASYGQGFVRTACPPNTSARNFTGNIEVDREVSRTLMVRLSYLYSGTQDLDIVTPFSFAGGTASFLGLGSTGGSHYHEFETTLRYRPTEGSQINVSYIHSQGRGDLNTLATIYVPFEQPVIHPNYIGNSASDIPNRMVSWGAISLPGKLTLSPVVDVRTGLPYSEVDAVQEYVGIPNGRRFPTFFSLDVKLYREINFSKLPLMGRFKTEKLRFGVYSLNVTNHGNFLDVYNDTASPYFGHFAGFQHRVDGLVIDLVD